jgi:hypothetical protein
MERFSRMNFAMARLAGLTGAFHPPPAIHRQMNAGCCLKDTKVTVAACAAVSLVSFILLCPIDQGIDLPRLYQIAGM